MEVEAATKPVALTALVMFLLPRRPPWVGPPPPRMFGEMLDGRGSLLPRQSTFKLGGLRFFWPRK